MTEQHWNFAGISQGAQGVQGSVVATRGLLEDGEAALKLLAEVWGGSSSTAYQAVQNKWNMLSNELNSALEDLARKIEEAGGTMGATEKLNEARFV